MIAAEQAQRRKGSGDSSGGWGSGKRMEARPQSQSRSPAARSSSVTSLDDSEAFTIITQLRTPSPGRELDVGHAATQSCDPQSPARTGGLTALRQELTALQQRNRDLEEANLELSQENSYLLVVAHEVEDMKGTCGQTQQELKARGEQLQAAEQRARDALEEVQQLQSALSGVRGELESERQIWNRREADSAAAKKRDKFEVVALQTAAESLRSELEEVVAELNASKAAGAADAERIAEQEKSEASLKKELVRLKAEQEKEQKARQVLFSCPLCHGSTFVPWLHICAMASYLCHGSMFLHI